MANSDQSQYVLRFNEITKVLEYGSGNNWTPATIASGGVTSINSLTGAVTLAAGSNITLTPSGNTITIASTGGGSGITQLTGYVTAGPGSGSQVATVVKVKGVTDGSDAAAGDVGEYMEITFASSVVSTSGAYQDFGILSLTAGDWDIMYQINGNEGDSTTITRFDMAVSINPGNDTTGFIEGINLLVFLPLNGATVNEQPMTIGRIRANITTPTNYYCKSMMTYTGGTPFISGIMSARRMR